MNHDAIAHVVDRDLSLRLLAVLAASALLTYAGRRRWITPGETLAVGIAMIFCASGWVMQSIVPHTMAAYGVPSTALLVAVALTAPLILSLAGGLYFLVRRLRKDASPSSSPAQPPRR